MHRPPYHVTAFVAGMECYDEMTMQKVDYQNEINRLNTIIHNKDVEIAKLKSDFHQVMELLPQVMQCSSPSPIYAMYLKELYLNFQLIRLQQGKNPSLESPNDFYDAWRESPQHLKYLLCGFYLHNLVVPYDLDQNPLLYMGDIHISALISWIQNEISRGEQFDSFKHVGTTQPLPIRKESTIGKRIYFDWKKLQADKWVFSHIHPLRAQVFYQYEQIVNHNLPHALIHSKAKWEDLTQNLQSKESHSPQNLHVATTRAKRHISNAQKLKENWLPLVTQPPILLWPLLFMRGKTIGAIVQLKINTGGGQRK